MKTSYYDVLGVERGASEADFGGLSSQAAKFHPDRNGDDPQAEENLKKPLSIRNTHR